MRSAAGVECDKFGLMRWDTRLQRSVYAASPLRRQPEHDHQHAPAHFCSYMHHQQHITAFSLYRWMEHLQHKKDPWNQFNQTYRVGQKTGPIWTLVTKPSLPVERRAMSQNFLECCRQKGSNLHSKSFNYYLPNLHKSSTPLKLSICLHSMCPSSLNSKTHCQNVQI